MIVFLLLVALTLVLSRAPGRGILPVMPLRWLGSTRAETATAATMMSYPDDPCLNPPAVCDPRILYFHTQGILFVTAAPSASGSPTPVSFVALWRDYATLKPYVFGRRIFSHTDLGHALLRLEALLDIDRVEFTSSSIALSDAVNWALAEPPDDTLWPVATRGHIATVLEFSPLEVTNPDDLLADDNQNGGLGNSGECGVPVSGGAAPDYEFADTAAVGLDDLARELTTGIDCCDEENCCSDNGDCAQGEHCVEGECFVDECSGDGDCPLGKVCEGGECVGTPCDGPGDCPAGQECDDGRCKDPCDDEGDCPLGDECVDGHCEDCPGECCDAGDCYDGDGCTIDACRRGACRHYEVSCYDGDKCTADFCEYGDCRHTPMDCDDDNPCTDDACDPETGQCIHLCKSDCAGCDADGNGNDDGLCKSCSCAAPSCNLGFVPESALACWGETIELTLIASCEPSCGSMTWQISANPPEGVQSIEPASGVTECDASSHVYAVEVKVACDPPPPTGPMTITAQGIRSGAVCISAMTIDTTECIDILGRRIDQDDPANASWAGWGEGSPIYGGSEPSTADNGRLEIEPDPHIVDIDWSWEGDGSAVFDPPPSGPNALIWILGDLMNPRPGPITFKVRITYDDGAEKCGDFESEIGVRTDDVIVVGWIDGSLVQLATIEVDPRILTDLPATGPPVPSIPACIAGFGGLTQSAEGWFPYVSVLENVDRNYILNWMFKYADNPDPLTVLGPHEFRDDADSRIDYARVEAYRAVKTQYKLFNHFQVRYRAEDGRFTELTTLRASTGIGHTPNPCGGFPAVFPGQTGPNCGPPAVVSPSNKRIGLIVDGSPDQNAIRAFNTLMGKGVDDPIFWESIGNQIRFSVELLTDAQVIVQPYPTYYVFKNGRRTASYPQASAPVGQFYPFPYPFGTVSCLGLWGITPGGRCGDAESPKDISARIPPFIVVP